MKRLRLIAVGLLVGTAAASAAVFGLPGQASKAATATSYQLPCSPYSVSGYGFGQWVSGWGHHVGEDVCPSAGAPVYAVADGTVMYSAKTPDSYRWGNLILIEHRNADGTAVVSLYGHLSGARQVSAGQTVGRGQLIGFVGPSWTAENGNWSAHLHFGINNGTYGAAVGTYASWVHGYETAGLLDWIHPSNYVRGRMLQQDFIGVSLPQDTHIPYTGSTQVTFVIKNNSNETWLPDGQSSTPVRLGTQHPRDRASGFSGNGQNAGWANTSRIKLVAAAAPGANATFRATLTSNGVPGGPYPECFHVVREGVKWYAGSPICLNWWADPPGYRAQWHTQMVTTNHDPKNLTGQTSGMYLLPGQKLNLKLLVKNAGEVEWRADGPNPVRLANSRPRDRASAFATGNDGSIPLSENWPRYDRPSEIDGRLDTATNTVVDDSTIGPGEIAVFSFTVTAPREGGTYYEYVNPVVEGVTHLPDLGMHFVLRVMSPGYHYEWVTQSITPNSVGQLTTNQDSILQIRNTGRESWPVNGDVKLGTWSPPDYQSWLYNASGTGAWLSPSRPSAIDRNVTNPAKDRVDPGEVAEFAMRFNIDGEIPQNNYRFYVRPLKENVAWFPEDYGMFLPVNVTVPPYKHQVRYQGYTASSVPVGGTLGSSLAIRNLGRATWKNAGSRPVRLGTQNPRDRQSAFYEAGGSDPWISPTRASGIDGRVTDLSRMTSVAADEIKPGETGLFKVPFKAGATAGTYQETFNLLAEGVTWFPSSTLTVPLTVTTGTSQPAPAPGEVWSATGDQYTACMVTGTSGASCTKDTVNHEMSSAWTFRADYQAPVPAGTYNLLIGYKNVNGVVPPEYNYSVKIRYNNGTSKTYTMPADNDGGEYSIPNVTLSGATSIRLEWTNDYWVPNLYDANLAITRVALYK